MPFHLTRTTEAFWPGQHVVTVCETGARAVIAASVLRARGIDARPVAAGGIPDLERLLTTASARP